MARVIRALDLALEDGDVIGSDMLMFTITAFVVPTPMVESKFKVRLI